MHLCRFSDSQGVAQLGLVRDGALYDISDRWPTLSAFLGWSGGRGELAAELSHLPTLVDQLGGETAERDAQSLGAERALPR